MKLAVFTAVLQAVAFSVTSANPIAATVTDEGLVVRANIPGPMKDDYPYKGNCGIVDKWNYYSCQCTSFVAWRINDRLGIKFTNQYKGVNWGDANTWAPAARKTGVTVNNKPVAGAIAWLDANQHGAYSAGHVAWVAAVSGSTVTLEEYNWGNPQKAYHTRTAPASQFSYIHIKV